MHGLIYSKYYGVFRLNGVTGEIIQNLKQLLEKQGSCRAYGTADEAL